MKRFLLACCLFLAALPCRADENGFVPLFDGKSLDGWVQRGGKATYAVENGEIVGTSVAKTENTFLCTEREYGDFILELDIKVDNELNSGVQIRSHVYDEPTEQTVTDAAGKEQTYKLPAGRVHGYQVEIDPSDRSWSGGIYDEARRGWLFDLDDDAQKDAREAFRRNDWNHYRIEAVGPKIKTWINGVPIADLADDLDPQGLIALQVHSVPDNLAGREVRWRNIKIKVLDETPAKPDATSLPAR
jgi:hypothetical protein